MALLVEKGTWTGDGTVSPITQTITLANSSLTPIAIIAWATGPGAAGSFAAASFFSMGFGTRRGGATQSGCICIANEDNLATAGAGRIRNTTLLDIMDSRQSRDYRVNLVSFAQGSFSVSYGDLGSTGDILHYLVFGGDDLTDATVLNWTMDATSGAEVITGAGFQGNVLFALDSDLATTSSISTNIAASFGFASSNANYRSMAITATNADTMASSMNWNKAFRSDACLERLTINADTSDGRWDLNSFDSDGVSLGVVDAPSATDRIATFLIIEGGQWEAGSKAKATGTGNDTFTLANSALTPKGIITFTTRQTAVGITTGNTDFCIGAGSSPSTTRGSAVNGVAGCTGPEAINTQADRFHATDAVIEELTGGATPAETSEAWFDTASAGSFILDWATNGGSSALIGYLAFGDNAAAPSGPPAGSLSLLGVGR